MAPKVVPEMSAQELSGQQSCGVFGKKRGHKGALRSFSTEAGGGGEQGGGACNTVQLVERKTALIEPF